MCELEWLSDEEWRTDDRPRVRRDHIAVVGIPWREFEDRFSMRFTVNDGRYSAPGPHAYAAVRLASGALFLLDHYYDYPDPGVLLSGREDEDFDAQRRAFARALGLTEGVFTQLRRGNARFHREGQRIT
jgi:hypothetical protein